MAKAKIKSLNAAATPKAIGHPDRKWEVHDAMHTMMRASEIVRDKALLAAVKREAKSYAGEMEAKADRAREFAKRGMISPKQMAKLGSR
jgi:hypothetical protein